MLILRKNLWLALFMATISGCVQLNSAIDPLVRKLASLIFVAEYRQIGDGCRAEPVYAFTEHANQMVSYVFGPSEIKELQNRILKAADLEMSLRLFRSAALSHAWVELIFELGYRIKNKGSKTNTPGFKGFLGDWYKRCVFVGKDGVASKASFAKVPLKFALACLLIRLLR